MHEKVISAQKLAVELIPSVFVLELEGSEIAEIGGELLQIFGKKDIQLKSDDEMRLRTGLNGTVGPILFLIALCVCISDGEVLSGERTLLVDQEVVQLVDRHLTALL